MRLLIAVVITGLSVTSAAAQTSKEYAQMAKRAWSAFECAALAAQIDKKDAHERLFKIGYQLGKSFIEATLAGRVNRSDISSTVPVGFTMSMQGPTPDFMLGVIWTGAYDSAHQGIYEEEFTGKPIDSSLWDTLGRVDELTQVLA